MKRLFLVLAVIALALITSCKRVRHNPFDSDYSADIKDVLILEAAPPASDADSVAVVDTDDADSVLINTK